MPATDRPVLDQRLLDALVHGLAGSSGQAFFEQLVRQLALMLGVKGAWVTEWRPARRRLRALAFWFDDHYIEDYEYDIGGTPCEPVINRCEPTLVAERVIELYPRDPDLPALGAVSYLGQPLQDANGVVLGHLAVLDDKPLAASAALLSVFRLFTARASAELARLWRDQALAEREARLRTLAAEARQLREDIALLQGETEILGESPPMRRMREELRRVAGLDTTVLVSGETGTGKELVASALHRQSGRAGMPFIRVNCAAIALGLQESEFFGHEKGAFTGALQRRDGRFKLADGGTLFLDEVGEMPPDLQAKLLRVLQEGEFERVGGGRTEKVDVRLIAATHRDLAAMVAEGSFRQDLWYRLNVFPLRVPPLRQRGDDILLLARALLARFARRHGLPLPELTEQDERRLRAYPWPGNVRELENVLERALIISPDGRRLALERALPEASPPPLPMEPDEAVILTAAELAALEKANLERALAHCQGRIAGPDGAAALLGLHPNTLSSRLKAIGLR
ncbi:sigma-54 interaction domain-containing protein [Zobellella iuensis]|uniref:Sigma-54-dependent Fis family transcriptional regulator n=1 Tax=Zobellella iuensis TaxID=2803811 RepID=A0ABS1QQR6_9GAMM|nr:sigma-54 dependent transcriptional regulator [Zobellella iuensis]MBL1376589.1 sigma-54-dependent Fis family transcriptional regulator [Zobellella iuensis]